MRIYYIIAIMPFIIHFLPEFFVKSIAKKVLGLLTSGLLIRYNQNKKNINKSICTKSEGRNL